MTEIELVEDDTGVLVATTPPPLVNGVAFDAGVTIDLLVGARHTISVRIEQQFDLIERGGKEHLVPVPVVGADDAALAALVRLWQLETIRIYADDDGTLDLHFADGSRLRCVAHAEFEAWTLDGPDDMTIVSGPGGELVVWGPDEL